MKRELSERMIAASKEQRMDAEVGYNIPVEYYTDKYGIPYDVEATCVESIRRFDKLTEEEKKDIIEVDGKKYIRKLYEQNLKEPTIGYVKNKYNLSLKQLAVRFDIPYRTVQNWNTGIRKCPDYIVKMMIEILENEEERRISMRVTKDTKYIIDDGCGDYMYASTLEEIMEYFDVDKKDGVFTDADDIISYVANRDGGTPYKIREI